MKRRIHMYTCIDKRNTKTKRQENKKENEDVRKYRYLFKVVLTKEKESTKTLANELLLY